MPWSDERHHSTKRHFHRQPGPFIQCIHLKTLSFGENIKTNIETIGDDAFYDCRILESVTIPQSVTFIGDHAFGCCYGMHSFTIKDATTSIGEYAFFDCQNLETLSLGENIKTIGYSAFNSCYLNLKCIPGKCSH